MADVIPESVPLVVAEEPEPVAPVPAPEPTPLPAPEPEAEPEPESWPVPVAAPPVTSKRAASAAPPAQPTLYSGRLFSHILGLVNTAWDTRRPWLDEFFDTAEFGFPDFSTLSRRVSRNLHYFESNYVIVATACVLLSVLNAAMGFALAVFFLYLIDKHAARKARAGPTSDKQRLIYVLGILLVFGLTGITDELLTAGVISAGIVAVHAVAHVPQEGTETAESAV